MLQPEDVFELLDQANLPGTVAEHPNWRRKLPLALERWSTRKSRRSATSWPKGVFRSPRRLPRTACSCTRASIH